MVYIIHQNFFCKASLAAKVGGERVRKWLNSFNSNRLMIVTVLPRGFIVTSIYVWYVISGSVWTMKQEHISEHGQNLKSEVDVHHGKHCAKSNYEFVTANPGYSQS